MSVVSYIGQKLPSGGGGVYCSFQITVIFINQNKHRSAEMMRKTIDFRSEAGLNRFWSERFPDTGDTSSSGLGFKEGTHSQWDQEGSPEAHHSSGNSWGTASRHIMDHSTLADTWMLFSCIFKMASEILMSMGSSTNLMLKGPLSLPATSNIASANKDSQTAYMLVR